MNTPAYPQIQSVLILKADRICADALGRVARRIFPSALVHIETSIAGARQVLESNPVELLVSGLGTSLGGDTLEFLAACAGPGGAATKVLVVTTHHEVRLLAGLRTLPVHGAFDSMSEPPEQMAVALQTVASGEYYWSQTILERMRASPGTGVPHPRLLTTCEQLVLSVIGGGADNATAAHELGMSIGTVSSIRRDLHRKLGVQHRGELMRVAAQNGFVQFTPFGIIRPGYALLTAAHNARKSKRTLTPALALA